MAERVMYVCNEDGTSTDTISGMVQHQQDQGHPHAGWEEAILYECECGAQYESLQDLINHCSAKGCTCYKQYQE
jgi:hypothetical protein